jgi:hypothetical protein
LLAGAINAPCSKCPQRPRPSQPGLAAVATSAYHQYEYQSTRHSTVHAP